MKQTTDRKTEITEALKGYQNQVEDMVSKFNPDYAVDSYKSYNEWGFNIGHKTRNWNNWVNVKITNKDEARFSHSTGPWNDGVTPEEIIESTIECMLIAKEIIGMKEEIAKITREMGKLEFELHNIYEREVREEREKAEEECLGELEGKYEKITTEEVIEKLKTQPNIKLIKPDSYDRTAKTIAKRVFEVANYGFDTNSRMNLYVLNHEKDFTGRSYVDEYKVSKTSLEDYMENAHIFTEEN